MVRGIGALIIILIMGQSSTMGNRVAKVVVMKGLGHLIIKIISNALMRVWKVINLGRKQENIAANNNGVLISIGNMEMVIMGSWGTNNGDNIN